MPSDYLLTHTYTSPIHFICPLLFIAVEILRIVFQNTATNHHHTITTPPSSSSSSSASQNLTPTLLLFPCTPPPLSPVPVLPLAPIRSIVPHDPATDCLRSILDTSSVFEVATSTLSACSSRKPGRRNSSSISGSNSNDSPIATAVGFKANFRREMKNGGLRAT